LLKKQTAKMLRLCGPAAKKPEVVKSYFYLKKAMAVLRKMQKTAPL
jgi:hypothetical protein